MKKIGFIDFFLDEWHANNYPEWIRNNCTSVGRDCELTYAWGETASREGIDTSSWCNRYGIKELPSIEALVEKSDYIIVLSPDNPEHHERLSRIPLMSGKPVYIDKTFSPDLASGVRMFELAGQHGTPVFSSSALRFSKELSDCRESKINKASLEYVATTGPGKYQNYSVHQFEMIVSLLGPGAARIKSLSSAACPMLVVEYSDGRRASFLQMQQAPFQVFIQQKDGNGEFISECSEMFPRFINSMMNFFETGKPPVPKEETLEIMAIIEAGRKALQNYDSWIKVEHFD